MHCRVLNQIRLSKHWYTAEIYTTPKIIKNEMWWTRCFRHRSLIRFSRTKMYSKFIKHYLSGKTLYWLNLKLNFNQGLSLFRQNHTSQASGYKSLQNQNNENFFRIYNTIYRMKRNADNKMWAKFRMWPKSFIKLFTSSGSSSQINF